jgi:hypothetical protein
MILRAEQYSQVPRTAVARQSSMLGSSRGQLTRHVLRASSGIGYLIAQAEGVFDAWEEQSRAGN